MAVRTKAELKAQIAALWPDNDNEEISEGDLRSVGDDIADSLAYQAALTALVDRVRVLEGYHAHMGDHARYFGWSDDRVIATSDLTAAAESDDNSGVIPARTTNGYVFFAVPETIGYPASVSINNGPNQIAGFEELANTVDDSQGTPHLIGITTREQAPAIAGDSIDLGY